MSDPKFLSSLPAMRLNQQSALAQAMADAGFVGNRWSTAAMRSAAHIGAELAANSTLSVILFDRKDGDR